MTPASGEKSAREVAVGVLHIGAGIFTLFLAFAFKDQLPVEKASSRIAGFLVLHAGIAVFAWAFLHIRGGIRGFVRPARASLVTTGPYRIVRHPVYAGLTLILTGSALVLRSAVGLAAVFLLFLPSAVNRAGFEEKALAATFGPEWERYAQVTGFLLPGVGRRKSHGPLP